MGDEHDALAELLTVISSPVRLQILHALRTPRAVGDLKIVAARTRKGENAGRHLARPTVHHHVEALEAIGLVTRIPADSGAIRFVVEHQRLFALVDQVRSLARLRSAVAVSDGTTMVATDESSAGLPPAPRLVLAYGRDDHLGFSLADGERWLIGRSGECHIVLDYDPYASGQHAQVSQTKAGFTLRDLGSSNGTLLNGVPVRAQVDARLAPGALIQIGRSILVFQAEGE